jgi:hypothetical protein
VVWVNRIIAFIRTWYGAAATLCSVALAAYYGVPKVSKTWDWYVEKWDGKVYRALKQPPLRRAYRGLPITPVNLSGVPSHRIEDLVTLTGRGPKSIEKSLLRLLEKGKAKAHDREWSIK